jgi:hypothetical protein
MKLLDTTMIQSGSADYTVHTSPASRVVLCQRANLPTTVYIGPIRSRLTAHAKICDAQGPRKRLPILHKIIHIRSLILNRFCHDLNRRIFLLYIHATPYLSIPVYMNASHPLRRPHELLFKSAPTLNTSKDSAPTTSTTITNNKDLDGEKLHTSSMHPSSGIIKP